MLDLYELDNLWLSQSSERCPVLQRNSISQHHLSHVPCSIVGRKFLVYHYFPAVKTGLS